MLVVNVGIQLVAESNESACGRCTCQSSEMLSAPSPKADIESDRKKPLAAKAISAVSENGDFEAA